MGLLFLALCAVVFVGGVLLMVVGKAVEGHYTRKLRRMESRMTPEQREAWFRAGGCRI